jgi:hypothetical protein
MIDAFARLILLRMRCSSDCRSAGISNAVVFPRLRLYSVDPLRRRISRLDGCRQTLLTIASSEDSTMAGNNAMSGKRTGSRLEEGWDANEQ